MLGRKHIDLKHSEIELVAVRRGLFGKFLSYGSVVVTSKIGDRIVFKAIADPDVLQQEVDQAVEIAVLGRRLSDFENIPGPASAPLAVRERTLADFDRLAEKLQETSREPQLISPSKPAADGNEETEKRPRVDPDQW